MTDKERNAAHIICINDNTMYLVNMHPGCNTQGDELFTLDRRKCKLTPLGILTYDDIISYVPQEYVNLLM